MKRPWVNLILCLLLSFYGSVGFANTILRVEFETDSSVAIPDNNTIVFTESQNFVSLFCWNNSFFVPNNAETLSFDWEVVLGSDDDYLTFIDDDYLTFIIDTDGNLTNEIHEAFPADPPTDPKAGDVISDHFSIPLTPYRGQYVYMEWGFNEGRLGENAPAGSTATISNIELSTEDVSPVPEPSTLIMLGAGLLFLTGYGKKRV
jgi:hypothetical protein